jgi:DNA-binding protein HU-beta
VTVTLKNLAAELAESHEVPKRQTEALLSDMVGLIAKNLKKGNRLRLVGLGILQVRHRAARVGRNPATGEPIKIKAARRSRSALPRTSRKRSDPSAFPAGVAEGRAEEGVYDRFAANS